MANIVLIDDDDALRNVLKILLQRLGHEVRDFAGGDIILEGRLEAEPEVVLTDVFMPHGEGMETIRAVRNQYPGAQVIVMSGGIPGIDARKILGWAQNLGANEALAKPFTPAELSLALEKVAA